MSATTSEDVDRLTKLVLHNPLSLDLLSAGAGAAGGGDGGAASGAAAGAAGAAAEITHYRIDLPPGAAAGGGAGETAERLLHLLALLKLGVVQRKVGRILGTDGIKKIGNEPATAEGLLHLLAPLKWGVV